MSKQVDNIYFFLLTYFLRYESSLRLILRNYTVSRSCNLQTAAAELQTQISTFAGNYNCELLSVLEQMGPIEQSQYP